MMQALAVWRRSQQPGASPELKALAKKIMDALSMHPQEVCVSTYTTMRLKLQHEGQSQEEVAAAAKQLREWNIMYNFNDSSYHANDAGDLRVTAGLQSWS